MNGNKISDKTKLSTYIIKSNSLEYINGKTLLYFESLCAA